MESIVFKDLEEDIDVGVIKKYLNDLNIKYQSINLIREREGSGSGKVDAVLSYKVKDIPDITLFDDIDSKLIPNTKSILDIAYPLSKTLPLPLLPLDHFKENDDIVYPSLYHEHIITQFLRMSGLEGLKFNDFTVFHLQRNIIQPFMSKIGFNIMSKSSLLNIALPIAFYDQRSLLEAFAHQCILSPYYLDKAGTITDNPIEVLKLTTAFFISKLHLTVTQLRPFNPFIGETFQCKIVDSKMYIERTTEPSLALNFFHIGKHFKSSGYQVPYAITNDNGVLVYITGNYTIQYQNGTCIDIIPCKMSIKGTMTGDRTIRLSGQCYIVDKGNNYLSYINFDKEEGQEYPDYFKGYILRLNQATYHQRNNTYTLNNNYTSLVEINGYWTKELILDDDVYWNYYEYTHYPLKRMKYTLPSDSTLREDIKYLKGNQLDNAFQMKGELEYSQRRDRRLREDCNIKAKNGNKK